MAFYQERIIPWLIHLSMRQRMLAPYRDRVVSSTRGDRRVAFSLSSMVARWSRECAGGGSTDPSLESSVGPRTAGRMANDVPPYPSPWNFGRGRILRPTLARREPEEPEEP